MTNSHDHASIAEAAEHFMAAVHLLDELVETTFDDAERAIRLILMAIAVKGGPSALQFMQHCALNMNREVVSIGKNLFSIGYQNDRQASKLRPIRKKSR